MSGGAQASASGSDRIFSTYPDQYDDAERQPLLRRQPTTRDENRELFQHNQRTAAQGVWQRSTCILLTVIVIIGFFFLVWAVMYYQALRTWWLHHEKPCDKNLANWLLAMLIMPFFYSQRRMRLQAYATTSSDYYALSAADGLP
jgi:hypothetical protein